MLRERSRSAGFTLIEAIVSLFVMVLLMVAILGVFDFTGRLSRVQMQLADMQQEQRIGQGELVRYLRMAGRGGLPTEIAPITSPPPAIPGHIMPNGASVARAVNNAVANTRIGDATSPLIYPNTDVLTVRGAFSTPVYQINYADPAQVQLFQGASVTTNPAVATSMRVQVCATSPAGIAQNLVPLQQAIGNASGEAILIVSPLQDSIFGVVALDPANSLLTSANCVPGLPAAGVTLALLVGTKGSVATRQDSYADLSPAPAGSRLMQALANVAFLSILEEYRYYIRQEYVVPADNTTTEAPRLSRARFYPNTNLPYAANAQNLSIDIAENVTDLQIAFGIDTNSNGVIDDVSATCGDEWQGNGAGTENPPVPPAVDPCQWNNKSLYYVRLSTLARTDRFDPAYVAPMMGQIEDHVFPTTATGENSSDNRHRRKRVVQTVVKLRNL